MNEEELLDALGERARARWSTQTAQMRPESMEGVSALTDEEEQSIVDGVLARLSEPERETAPPDPIPLRAPPGEPAPAANDPPGSRRWLTLVGTVVAVAAALLLWRSMTPSVAGLPGYDDAGWEGGVAPVRSEQPESTDGPAVLRPDGELRWRLRPRTAVEGAVELRILAQGSEQRCLTVAQGLRIADSGAIELSGRVDAVLDLPPGPWTLTAIVGRPEALAALDDPCAWQAEGRSAPAGVVAAARREVVVRVAE